MLENIWRVSLILYLERGAIDGWRIEFRRRYFLRGFIVWLFDIQGILMEEKIIGIYWKTEDLRDLVARSALVKRRSVLDWKSERSGRWDYRRFTDPAVVLAICEEFPRSNLVPSRGADIRGLWVVCHLHCLWVMRRRGGSLCGPYINMIQKTW